ncbi:hypothetical protein A2368_00815 [Candidatus Collierbacteria bacterium RIFOXYB1_FULL_49_13]|uniref:Uncharacterized protein n=1 Tax=Candidatus Collierbacteria bacterium RIFOXYB1_FULL_49_13 TaxID=1817728 RepID=A0A1F5FHS5_9BACT|nr:MAG: hypothetical protein A2368_00815 [Candidatus Collierbacteria bacterium RIFOXYB1_FULL_49_13]
MKRRTRREKVLATERRQRSGSTRAAAQMMKVADEDSAIMSFPYLKRDLTKTLALTMLALGVEAAIWLFLKK